MKPEPLKGKCCETRAGNPIHLDKDIRSAVEWLKKECQNHQNYGEKSWLFKKINETFEDVTGERLQKIRKVTCK